MKISMNRLFGIFKKTREQKIKEKCGCCCYCPYCTEPLNDNSAVQKIHNDGIYEYTCAKCESKSIFHFGIAPVPIWLKKK